MLGDAPVHGIIPTHDITTARQFYENKLGLKVVDETPDGGLLFGAGGSEFLLYQTQAELPAQTTAIAFPVTDVAQEVSDLEARGIAFEEYDLAAMGIEGAPPGPQKIVEMSDVKGSWFKDPEGNIIGVYERV